MEIERPASPRPRLFVGSSTQGRPTAELFADGMAEIADVTLWSQGIFTPPLPNAEGVLDATRDFDFAAFVMAPGEVSPKPGGNRGAARDGIALQLGVFLGALGRQRTFIVCSTETMIELPSDLRGVTLATFRPASHGNLSAALGCACTIVREQIRRLAPSAAPAKSSVRNARAQAPQVARRRRRESLGSACAVGPKRVLRIGDISLSGAFLETYGEMPEGQMLDLDLTLDDGARVRVTAKVVRVQHPQWGRIGGIGVAFLKFEGDSRAALERYLDSDPTLTRELASPAASRR